jgi:SAM-dependent methyltransferase
VSYSDDVARAWRESATFWERHAETVGAMFGPISDRLIGAARVASGARVLDVAGGAGDPSLALASTVSVDGLVVCTDQAPGMVAAARRRAIARGASSVRFAQCSGDALPVRDASFDATVCRLGLMFFPDANRGVDEMLRVARPGGRVALAVWGAKDRNPYLAVPSTLAERYAPSDPEPADAPGAWRFAEPGVLAELLRAAGAADVVEELVAFDIVAPISFEAFWTVRVELSDTLRTKVARVGPYAAASLAGDVRSALGAFFDQAGARIPAEALVVSGAKR